MAVPSNIGGHESPSFPTCPQQNFLEKRRFPLLAKRPLLESENC
jgi:hypothetical protein